MANGWTQARREQQARAIRRWQPWKASTGPRTEKGKAAVSQNAWRGGGRQLLRALSKVLSEQRRALRR